MTFYQDHLPLWIWVSGYRTQVNSFLCQHSAVRRLLGCCFFPLPAVTERHTLHIYIHAYFCHTCSSCLQYCFNQQLESNSSSSPPETAESESNDVFVSSTLTFAWGQKAFAKGGVFPDWNEGAEWRFLKHRDLWQPLCRLLITADPFIKHSILHRWRPEWGAGGAGGRSGMSGHLTRTLLEEIGLWAETQSPLLNPSYMFFCISGHVVQDPHGGRCSSRRIWKSHTSC